MDSVYDFRVDSVVKTRTLSGGTAPCMGSCTRPLPPCSLLGSPTPCLSYGLSAHWELSRGGSRERGFPPELAPRAGWVDRGSLHYLRHLRHCAAFSWGCQSSAGGGEVCGRALAGGLGLPRLPFFLDLGLEAAFHGSAWLSHLGLEGLLAVTCPGVWLPLLGALVLHAGSLLGALVLHMGSDEAVGLTESLAVACGSPVPVLALRAAWGGEGWRFWVGLAGFVAWGVGAHCPGAWGLEACQAASLLVSTAGLKGWGLGSYLVLEASLRRPAFPGQDRPISLDVVTWAVDLKPSAAQSTCCNASCKGPIEKGTLRARSTSDRHGRRWFHVGCVDGGLGPSESVEGLGTLSTAQWHRVAACCDQPGGTSRAEFVAQFRGDRSKPPPAGTGSRRCSGAGAQGGCGGTWFGPCLSLWG